MAEEEHAPLRSSGGTHDRDIHAIDEATSALRAADSPVEAAREGSWIVTTATKTARYKDEDVIEMAEAIEFDEKQPKERS